MKIVFPVQDFSYYILHDLQKADRTRVGNKQYTNNGHAGNYIPLHFQNSFLKLSWIGQNLTSVKLVFHLAIFSREQAKSECDRVVMSSAFVASKPSCLFLCSRANSHSGKQV